MDGGDRAGYKQISKMVDAILIGPSTGSTAVTQSSDYTAFPHGWGEVQVISTKAIFASVTAPGLIGSSKLDSGTTWYLGARICCNQITGIKLSCDSTGGAVIAYGKVIL